MKRVLSCISLVGGVLFWSLGFCISFNPSTADAAGVHIKNNTDLLLILVNLACFAIGSLLLWLAYKINPEPFSEALSDEECTVDDYEPEQHDYYAEKRQRPRDYSNEFDELYNQIILERTDKLIQGLNDGEKRAEK